MKNSGQSAGIFRNRLMRDALIILMSILIAITLSKSGFLSEFFLVNAESRIVGSFFAGVFFTSFFTSPLAFATFATLAPSMNVLLMALIGGMGAVLGDLVIFGLLRYAFRQDIEHVMSVPRYKRFFAIFHRRMFRWVLPFIGAIFIASPLPNEVGLGLMGVSRMSVRNLIAISFSMNTIGILLIGLIV